MKDFVKIGVNYYEIVDGFDKRCCSEDCDYYVDNGYNCIGCGTKMSQVYKRVGKVCTGTNKCYPFMTQLLDELEEENKKLREDLEDINLKYQNDIVQVSKICSNNVELIKENKDLKSKLEKSLVDNDYLYKDNCELHSDYLSVKNELIELKGKLKNSISTLTSFSNISERIARVSKDRDIQKEKVKQLEEECNRLSDDNVILDSKLNKSEERIKELESLVDFFTQAMEMSIENSEDMIKTINSVKND